MNFDLPTLMAAGSFIAAMSAMFVFFAWTHARDGRELLWWAAGDLFYAGGVAMLLLGTTPGNGLMTPLGATVYNAAPILFWLSARLFNGRRPALFLFAFLLVPLATLAPPLASRPGLAMALALATVAIVTAFVAWEYWRGRSDGSKARGPLIGLCLLQSVIYIAGAIEAATGQIASTPFAPTTSWFGLVHFTSILFLLGTAVFVVALSRERSEHRQKQVAETDALTGVYNRGALMARAQIALEASLQADIPLSLILFDLDGFKSINDRFGHATGDRVLRLFGETVQATLRKDDHVGRIGGEEFVVVLPETSLGEAFGMADRIRVDFESRCRMIDGVLVNATVSAGVTTAHPQSNLDSILAAADDGLYSAKQNGRNRVERPRPKSDGIGGPNLERVA